MWRGMSFEYLQLGFKRIPAFVTDAHSWSCPLNVSKGLTSDRVGSDIPCCVLLKSQPRNKRHRMSEESVTI